MIRINLLPHRERKRQQRKREFGVLLAFCAVLGGVLVGAGAMWNSAELAAQEQRNAFLKAENERLDGEIKEIANLKQEIDGLRARQAAVENLQGDRTVPVRLLDDLVRLTPEGLYLRGIRQEATRVTLSGHAQSNERVSELLRNLASAQSLFERSDLVEIKAVQIGTNPREAKRLFEFSLVAQLKRPPSPDASAATGSAKVASAR